jgi:hypothetical protein
MGNASALHSPEYGEKYGEGCSATLDEVCRVQYCDVGSGAGGGLDAGMI